MQLSLGKKKVAIITVILLWISIISFDYSQLIRGYDPIFMFKFKPIFKDELYDIIPRTSAIGLGYFASYYYTKGDFEGDKHMIVKLDFYIAFIRVAHLDML
jgi:hypothetical protein